MAATTRVLWSLLVVSRVGRGLVTNAPATPTTRRLDGGLGALSVPSQNTKGGDAAPPMGDPRRSSSSANASRSLVVLGALPTGAKGAASKKKSRRAYAETATSSGGSSASGGSPFAFADVAVAPTVAEVAAVEAAAQKKMSVSSASGSARAAGTTTTSADAKVPAAEVLAALDEARALTEAAIDAARGRAREARLETSRLLASAASIKAASTNDVRMRVLAEAEKTLVDLRASRRDAELKAAAASRSRAADVAQAVRVAKTELAQAQAETQAAVDELAAFEAGDLDRTDLAKAQAQAAAMIAAAEQRVKDAVTIRVEPRAGVIVAGLAGLLVSDFLGLDKIDLYVAAAAVAIMLAAIPKTTEA
mmetsp:Transcript_15206/g.61121  ORF Transcript_15206/g.61121 Transcript_15206/m.61121 type:complete len:363 (+) Transcript_15206:842-1930(+)